jgi:hypothetical protein
VVSYVIRAVLESVNVGGVSSKHGFLSLSPVTITLPPLPPLMPPGVNIEAVKRRLLEAMPTVRLDLTQALHQLGMTSPQQAVAVLAQGAVAARFDPMGSAQRRLAAGQDWGLFVDAMAIERIVVDRLSPPVMRAVPEARVNAHYQVDGGVPRVIVEIELTIEGDFIGHPKIRLVIDIGATLSLLPHPARLLRVSVDWSFHIFADAVPGFLEALAEKLAESVAADLIDPKRFGAVRTGDRSLVIDIDLPAMALPGVFFRYDALPGTADGMTLGGAAFVSRYANAPFKLRVWPLASPLRTQLCSQLARISSGAPSPEAPSIFNTKSYAQLQIDGSGALCAIEQRMPATPMAAYMSAPPVGSTDDTLSLNYAIPYAVAMGLAQPLTLVVRTARGVRFVDLGHAPPVRIDAAGVLLDKSRDYYIPDCLNVVPRGKGAYGLDWGLRADEVKTRPIEEPDWAVYLQNATLGLVVQMVRVHGLDAHELLRFRSASHAIDVTADASGRASVPVMLHLAAEVGPAQLMRADGRTLQGQFHVEMAVFERHLTVPGRLLAPGVASGSGDLRLATRTCRQTLVIAVTDLGATLRHAASGEEVELNPQPLPPVEVPAATVMVAMPARLLGLNRIVALPGFDDVAVALMADGSKLLLDTADPARPRIAGTFAGPVGEMAVTGRWAVSQTGDTVAVFRTTAHRGDLGCCAPRLCQGACQCQ